MLWCIRPAWKVDFPSEKELHGKDEANSTFMRVLVCMSVSVCVRAHVCSKAGTQKLKDLKPHGSHISPLPPVSRSQHEDSRWNLLRLALQGCWRAELRTNCTISLTRRPHWYCRSNVMLLSLEQWREVLRVRDSKDKFRNAFSDFVTPKGLPTKH